MDIKRHEAVEIIEKHLADRVGAIDSIRTITPGEIEYRMTSGANDSFSFIIKIYTDRDETSEAAFIAMESAIGVAGSSQEADIALDAAVIIREIWVPFRVVTASRSDKDERLVVVQFRSKLSFLNLATLPEIIDRFAAFATQVHERLGGYNLRLVWERSAS